MDHSAKDRLILEQWEEIKHLRGEVERWRVEAERLKSGVVKVPKTPKNSSIPPSKEQKASREDKPPKPRSVHHHEGGRELAVNPNHRRALKCCPECHEELENQTLQGIYDRYDLPLIWPTITQISRYKGFCKNCQKEVMASIPADLGDLSAFGSSIRSLATYYRYEHAISYVRLNRMFQEVFHIPISEGSLSAIFKKAREPFSYATQEISETLKSSHLIGSDETSARVNGRTQWEWVFQNSEACLHVIRPSRGSEVKEDVLNGHWPEVWVSDLLASQRNHHAGQFQACLSHQLRDCQYGIDSGDQVFSEPMKELLKESLNARSLPMQERLEKAEASKIELDELLKLGVQQPDGLRLQKRYSKLRENLFVFLEDDKVPATNNASEQALRWSTVFRKVTHGFRSEWGKDLFGEVRSVINTGKRQGLTSYQSILKTLQPAPT